MVICIVAGSPTLPNGTVGPGLPNIGADMATALAAPPAANLFSASDRCRLAKSFELRASWFFLSPVNSFGRNRREALGDGGEDGG